MFVTHRTQVFSALLGCFLYASGCPASPNPEGVDDAQASASPGLDAVSPKPTAEVETRPVDIPLGQRVENGLVAIITGTEPDVSWAASKRAMPSLGKCGATSVAVTHRYEAATHVIVEAVAEFKTPDERGAFVAWLTLDSTGRVASVHAVGDAIWAARCLSRCVERGGCPAPRLSELSSPTRSAKVLHSNDARRAQLETAYKRWLAQAPGEGGYERWISADIVLTDMTSGRLRHGIDGVVAALKAVRRHYPPPHRVEALKMSLFGDTVVARFLWEAKGPGGEPVRRAMVEVVTFDPDARVLKSRGYGMPLAGK